MNIRAHYDLPNSCIVDVEIQRPKEGEGHIASILARKGRDSLTKYVLQPRFFPELRDPQINVNTFDLDASGDEDVLVKIYSSVDEVVVYFYLCTRAGRGTLVVNDEKQDVFL